MQPRQRIELAAPRIKQRALRIGPYHPVYASQPQPVVSTSCRRLRDWQIMFAQRAQRFPCVIALRKRGVDCAVRRRYHDFELLARLLARLFRCDYRMVIEVERGQ